MLRFDLVRELNFRLGPHSTEGIATFIGNFLGLEMDDGCLNCSFNALSTCDKYSWPFPHAGCAVQWDLFSSMLVFCLQKLHRIHDVDASEASASPGHHSLWTSLFGADAICDLRKLRSDERRTTSQVHFQEPWDLLGQLVLGFEWLFAQSFNVSLEYLLATSFKIDHQNSNNGCMSVLVAASPVCQLLQRQGNLTPMW